VLKGLDWWTWRGILPAPSPVWCFAGRVFGFCSPDFWSSTLGFGLELALTRSFPSSMGSSKTQSTSTIKNERMCPLHKLKIIKSNELNQLVQAYEAQAWSTFEQLLKSNKIDLGSESLVRDRALLDLVIDALTRAPASVVLTLARKLVSSNPESYVGIPYTPALLLGEPLASECSSAIRLGKWNSANEIHSLILELPNSKR